MRRILVLAAVVTLLLASGCSSDLHRSRQNADIPSVDRALAGGQPYVISVLGDSTGNDTNEWVHILARRISSNYAREVTVHDWHIDTSAYAKDTTYGSGAPTTIWNASASGQSAQYAVEHFDEMVPRSPDLTFINHGHNDPWNALSGITQLVSLVGNKGSGQIAVILQNPRLDGGRPGRAHLESTLFQSIAHRFSNPDSGVILVDVFSKFPTGDALAGALKPDGLHPTDEWEQVWADTVAQRLGIR